MDIREYREYKAEDVLRLYALLRAVLERFNGVRQIELTTDDTPETAAFYRSLGFADFAGLGCRGFMLD